VPLGRAGSVRAVIGTVEIAGGGIAGLTTGLAFARKGWRVRVHEQDSELRILGAGIYIWENGLRVLDALGVLNPVIAGTIPASRHEKRNHDGTLFSQSRQLEAQRAATDRMGAARHWYGQLALLPPAARNAAFKAIESSEALKRATLFAGARHDPTAADYWRAEPDLGYHYMFPLVH
jgi:2-polyprenyl-6-methoxyphenol hydroxylase-like FAD-dependent oxidoreductase